MIAGLNRVTKITHSVETVFLILTHSHFQLGLLLPFQPEESKISQHFKYRI